MASKGQVPPQFAKAKKQAAPSGNGSAKGKAVAKQALPGTAKVTPGTPTGNGNGGSSGSAKKGSVPPQLAKGKKSSGNGGNGGSTKGKAVAKKALPPFMQQQGNGKKGK